MTEAQAQEDQERPQLVELGGKLFGLSLFIVRRKNADGTPSLLEYVREDDVVDMKGQPEFLTGYLPVRLQSRVVYDPEG